MNAANVLVLLMLSWRVPWRSIFASQEGTRPQVISKEGGLSTIDHGGHIREI